jgi:aspartyl-tRNA(Asn)/glutamyl-tRNA(Gln) amidotransferase subunit A
VTLPGFADWRGLDPREAAERILSTAPRLHGHAAAIASLPDQTTLAGRFAAAVKIGGPLAGIPFFAKDLFDAAGEPVRAGSAFLDRVRPPPECDGALLRDARAAGLVYAGRTHLHEFAYGLTGENAHFGDCPHPSHRPHPSHPAHPKRLSGGSSSGSAWAVGSGLVPLAFGTDTGGSIRVPAAWCGIYGVRWTRNAWIRDGAFPLAPSFDAAGWFTARADDMAEMVRWRGGGQESGVRGQKSEVRSQRSEVGGRMLWLEPERGIVNEEVLTACRAMARDLGAEVGSDSARPGIFSGAAQAYAVLQSCEAFAVHEAWIDSHAHEYDPNIRALIDRGRRWSPSDLTAAAASRAAVCAAFEETFADWNLIVLPAVPTGAPTKAESTPDLRARILALTTPASLAVLPALTLPVPLPNGLTAGLQVLCPPDRMSSWPPLLAALAK